MKETPQEVNAAKLIVLCTGFMLCGAGIAEVSSTSTIPARTFAVIGLLFGILMIVFGREPLQQALASARNRNTVEG